MQLTSRLLGVASRTSNFWVPCFAVIGLFFGAACTDAAKKGKGSPAPDKPEASMNNSSSDMKAPEKFVVELNTTKGKINIEINRKSAPKGVDRFYTLVKKGFFEEIAFFRVVSGFVAQFGIHGDPSVSKKWKQKKIIDDPVKGSNRKGTLTFATAGPNTRTTQLFLNLNDNSRLDGMGFASFGEVTKGMDIVMKLYSGYGEGAPMGSGPSQGKIQAQGNTYLKKDFAKLDYIKSAIIK